MKQRLVFAILIVLSSLSFAASKKAQNPPVDPNADENYSIPVQETGVQIVGTQMEYKPRAVDYVFNTSSWVPNNYYRPSSLNSNSNFEAGQIPQLAITRVAPIAYTMGGIFEYDVGISYSQLVRNGLVDTGAGSLIGATETLTVASLRLGVGYRLPGLFTRYLQPSVDLSLLPTWISSPKSEFEAYGVSSGGILFEGSVSLLYCPDFMQKSGYAYQNTGEGFGIGYMMTAGSLAGGDMSGGGVEAILRMAL